MKLATVTRTFPDRRTGATCRIFALSQPKGFTDQNGTHRECSHVLVRVIPNIEIGDDGEPYRSQTVTTAAWPCTPAGDTMTHVMICPPLWGNYPDWPARVLGAEKVIL